MKQITQFQCRLFWDEIPQVDPQSIKEDPHPVNKTKTPKEINELKKDIKIDDELNEEEQSTISMKNLLDQAYKENTELTRKINELQNHLNQEG